jgi:hypothetical protein
MSLSRIIRSRSVVLGLALAAFCMSPAWASAQTTPASAPRDQKKPEPTVTLTTKPTPPAAGETTFTVTARDAGGESMTGADVSVELVMPPMGPMGQMKNTIALKPSADPKVAAEGTYVGTGAIMMAGAWNVTVYVKAAGKVVAQSKLTMTAK